ncbi:MAG TPA: hypothetical protein VKT77_02260 [Chthonomonadaceae bacterium]|nr:hypothetical protein [Chthonomonadaceae bacterium]
MQNKRSRATGRPEALAEAVEPRDRPSGGHEDLASHDFPADPQQIRREHGRVAIDTGAPPPEKIQPSGQPGTRKGDRQPVGDVGAIMDEYSSTPTDIVDR